MAAPFRIRSFQEIKPAAVAAGAAPAAPAAPMATNIQSYMDKLIKLIPAEVIAIYLTGKGFFPTPTTTTLTTTIPNDNSFIGIWSSICLLLVIIVRIWGTRDINNPTKKIQWPAVVISAISFVIWVYAVGGYFFDKSFKLEPEEGYIVSLVILVWTFTIPIFYKGDQ